MRRFSLPALLVVLACCFVVFFRSHAGRSPDAPVRIITLGDSITSGLPGKSHEAFASLLQRQLKNANVECEVINVGIGAENTTLALSRLKTDVIDKKPDIVTIMYGANDSYVVQGRKEGYISQKDYRDNLIEIVDELRQAGIKPILMTCNPYGASSLPNGAGEHPDKSLAPYVQICRDVAKEMDVPLVDHYEIWTQANAAGTNVVNWMHDEIHPNANGHQEMMNAIMPVILNVLRGK